MTISKIKKRGLILLASLLLIFLLVIACVSPLAKYLLQKYDVSDVMGREITIESAYVNPFTGYVCLSDIKIYESHSDSVFIAAKSLSGNFAMLKLLSGTYEVDQLTLTEPKVNMIQKGDSINIQDIIDFYTPKKPRTKKKAPLHLNLLNMEIKSGDFFYHERSIPVNYSVKKLNAKSPGLRWDVDSMNIAFEFMSGNDKGKMKGDMVVDVTNGNYKMVAKLDKYDLYFLEQYLKDLSNFGKFRAFMDADFEASGNFNETQNINTSGKFIVSDLHIGKKKGDDYVSFKTFALKIDRLYPKQKKYMFDSISLVQPFVKFELYDRLNNIEMMFGEKGQKAVNHSEFNIIVDIGRYIEQLAKNFFRSDYKINRLAIYNGDFKYIDYTLAEKFAVSANPVYFIADSIMRGNKPVEFSFRSGIKPYGEASVFISINPKDSSDFDLHYNFEQIPITLFNPYMIQYTSYPLDRGTLQLSGKWKVRNGYINSSNHITVIDPRIYKRVDNGDNKRLPIRLITYLVRERGNVIDYEIPVTGNLKSPKFHFKDVILDVAENIFVKPARAAYIAKVRKLEKKIDRSRVLRWEMRQSTLSPDQESFLDYLSDFMLENPQVNLEIDQSVYAEKEKEYILLFEAKKRYYLHKYGRQSTHLTQKEEEEIEQLSIKDSLFIHYLDTKTKQPLLFTVQDKCLALVGEETVEAGFRKLLKDRETAFMNYFKNSSFSNRIRIKPMEDKIPYNGFSSYRIDYKGDLPPELEKALAEMDDLNNRAPRKKFKKDRDTRRSLIRANNRRKRS